MGISKKLSLWLEAAAAASLRRTDAQRMELRRVIAELLSRRVREDLSVEELAFLEEVRDRAAYGEEILEAHWEGLKVIAERLRGGPSWGTAVEREEAEETVPFDDSNVADDYDTEWD